MTFLQAVYDYFFTDNTPNGEEYVKWPLGGAAYSVWLLIITYITFVFRIGPYLMRNREAFQLRGALLIYNVLQILFNSYFAIVFINKTLNFHIGCIERLPLDHPIKDFEVVHTYFYFLLKLFDLCDTIFIVLRKSYKQVTFLHVYHHAMLVIVGQMYIRYHGGGGQITLMSIMNSIVHVFMYFYYFLSGLRPNMKQSLWWKKYITILQLLQFVLILLTQAWPIVVHRSCKEPHIWLYMTILQSLIMIWLFGNFYIKAYIRRPTKVD